MILEEKYTLSNGVKIPKLGLGTWFINDTEVVHAVKNAVEIKLPDQGDKDRFTGLDSSSNDRDQYPSGHRPRAVELTARCQVDVGAQREEHSYGLIEDKNQETARDQSRDHVKEHTNAKENG